MSQRYDVIIIGSGAGGGTLAYRLAPTGKRILILERGDYLRREPDNWNTRAVFGDNKYKADETWRDRDGKPFRPGIHYYVGGNTKVYGAVLFRLRERDFGEVQHVDGVSPAWPIGYDELEPYYTRDEPRIAQLRSDLEAAGLQPFYLPTGIMLDEERPESSPCIRCATCDGFPC